MVNRLHLVSMDPKRTFRNFNFQTSFTITWQLHKPQRFIFGETKTNMVENIRFIKLLNTGFKIGTQMQLPTILCLRNISNGASHWIVIHLKKQEENATLTDNSREFHYPLVS